MYVSFLSAIMENYSKLCGLWKVYICPWISLAWAVWRQGEKIDGKFLIKSVKCSHNPLGYKTGHSMFLCELKGWTRKWQSQVFSHWGLLEYTVTGDCKLPLRLKTNWGNKVPPLYPYLGIWCWCFWRGWWWYLCGRSHGQLRPGANQWSEHRFAWLDWPSQGKYER